MPLTDSKDPITAAYFSRAVAEDFAWAKEDARLAGEALSSAQRAYYRARAARNLNRAQLNRTRGAA